MYAYTVHGLRENILRIVKKVKVLFTLLSIIALQYLSMVNGT